MLAQTLPVIGDYLIERAGKNMADVTQDALSIAGMDGPGLIEWIQADDRHAALLIEAYEAACATMDGYKVRVFAHVLADGLTSDAARIDTDQLVIRALRELETGHLQLMSSKKRVELAASGRVTSGISYLVLRRP